MGQGLCECWLVPGGPGLSELTGSEIAMGAVGSVLVVVDPPVLDEHLGLEQAVELPAVEELVARSRPLNDSIQAFCHGEPGSMNTVPTSLNRHPVGDGGGDELGPVEVPNGCQGAAAGFRLVVGRVSPWSASPQVNVWLSPISSGRGGGRGALHSGSL